MGHATAEAVLRAGLTLVPFSFTGSSEAVAVGNVAVSGYPVELIAPDARQRALRDVKASYPGLIIIDYTLPTAVNDNALFYCENEVPFVMGTTGGDRLRLLEDVKKSGNWAVIAPQMGKQVVALQATLELMAERFPGAFGGYSLSVTESHQAAKADTSGTAKAIVESFVKLGVVGPKRSDGGGSSSPTFEAERDIVRVRDRATQLGAMKVPESALSGHAFHTYRLDSPDGSVHFEFQHNVCGRTIYAEGTVDAALFLASRVASGAEGEDGSRVFNMVDVLREGAMR